MARRVSSECFALYAHGAQACRSCEANAFSEQEPSNTQASADHDTLSCENIPANEYLLIPRHSSGDVVIRHVLRLRLTSARSSRRLLTLGSTVASVISQGNSRDLSAYACRITAFHASIGLWQFWLPYPAAPPLSASCSSGQHFAWCFLQIRSHPRHPFPLADTSPCRVCRGLSPPSHQRGHHSHSGCAYAPCMAHHKKPAKGRVWLRLAEASYISIHKNGGYLLRAI